MSDWSVADIPPQAGRLAIVTGGTSGLGWETALALTRAGGEVILTARSEAKGQDAVDRIHREVLNARVRFELLDLASLDSIGQFLHAVGSLPRLDLLVNNAGVMAIPERELTEDGFERQFGTNFLGPFVITQGLFPLLQRSDRPRVVTVASMAATMGLRRINFEDVNWDEGYTPSRAYSQSKLADLMFALELASRAEAAGLPLVSVGSHPGFARTHLFEGGQGRTPGRGTRWMLRLFAQDAASGALPSLRAATDPTVVTGTYYGPGGRMGSRGPPVVVKVPPIAMDHDARARLWEVAEELTGVRFDLGRAGLRPRRTEAATAPSPSPLSGVPRPA